MSGKKESCSVSNSDSNSDSNSVSDSQKKQSMKINVIKHPSNHQDVKPFVLEERKGMKFHNDEIDNMNASLQIPGTIKNDYSELEFKSPAVNKNEINTENQPSMELSIIL